MPEANPRELFWELGEDNVQWEALWSCRHTRGIHQLTEDYSLVLVVLVRIVDPECFRKDMLIIWMRLIKYSVL